MKVFFYLTYIILNITLFIHMVVKYYTNNSSNLLGGTLIYVCHQRTYTNTIIEHNTFIAATFF